MRDFCCLLDDYIFKILFFAWWNIWVFHDSSFFSLRYFFIVNVKAIAIVWHNPLLASWMKQQLSYPNHHGLVGELEPDQSCCPPVHLSSIPGWHQCTIKDGWKVNSGRPLACCPYSSYSLLALFTVPGK